MSIHLVVNAQIPDYNFTQYTTTQGLSGNEVVKTVKDKNGFLWVATHNGLSRFDGKQFKNYTYLPNDSTSLRSIWITDLIVDKKNTLWVSTEWGICWYDEVYDRFRYINNKNDLVILYKAPFVLDKNNHLWFACESGLFKIDEVQKKYTKTAVNRIADPQSIEEDNEGNIWIGTRGNGLMKYNPTSNQLINYTNIKLPAATHFIQLLNDGNILWAATSEGLFAIANNNIELYNKATAGLSSSIYNQLTCLLPLNDNGTNFFICGTYDKKLLLFDKSKKLFVHQWKQENNLPTSIFNNIYKDDRIIWLATQNGLCKMENGFANFNWINIHTANNSLFQQVKADINNPEKYWLLADNNGCNLILYDKKTNAIINNAKSKTQLEFSNNKSLLLQNKKGILFTFSNQYINSFAPNGIWLSETKIEKTIFSACFDEKENIWIGTDEGLAYFETETKKINYYNHNFSGTDVENKSTSQLFPVVGVSKGSGNNLWIACIKYGLFSFDIVTKNFQAHRQASSASYETLNRCATVIATKDTIWVSSMAGIVAFLPSTNKFINYNSANGLASTYVYSIAEAADGSIWGRGNTGVFNFNTTTQLFINYNLPATFDVLYYMQTVNASNNECLLGLQNSIATFNSRTKNNEIKILITGLQVNDKPSYDIYSNNQFTHNSNNLQFDFTTINYNNEPEVFYYLLEGFNKDWVEATNKNNVLFTNLPPHDYVFNVKAKNGITGKFSNIASYSFTIKAAFWQRTWFKVASVLATLLLLLLVFRWRISTIKKMNAEKEKTQTLSLKQFQKQLELEKITNFFSASMINKNSIDDVLWDVSSNLIGKLDFEDCMIYLWNENKTVLIQKAGYGQKGNIQYETDKEKFNVKKGQGIIGAAALMKSPLIINDTTIDPRYRTVDSIVRLSEICVPILSNDEQIGMINAESAIKNFFTTWHVQTLTTIATLIADKIKSVEANNTLHLQQLELANTNTQLATTELSLLRSQMNPHFIFNSLNSIQKYIWENKEEDAAEYLASFARLMRAILENSRHEFITLKEEMDIIKLYVDLEHRRSNHRFDYLIKIDEEIDVANTLVPPLLLQPFIENAIWHGLNKKTDKGNLNIDIYKKGNELVAIVDDDGIGRQQIEKSAIEKKSLGISITKQRIEKLMNDAGKHAAVCIEDKIENGLPVGTKVTVTLPLKINANA